MGQYKTVKEVCALTGLTGKHLYYFHHENVVRAAAYANYSVEGNDGYKLYDEAGVEKLRQIALLYELGLKRNEIRDLMLASDYDFQRTLTELYRRKEGEIEKIKLQLAAMEYLNCVGVQYGLAGIRRYRSLEELGRYLLEPDSNGKMADIAYIGEDGKEHMVSYQPENNGYALSEKSGELFTWVDNAYTEMIPKPDSRVASAEQYDENCLYVKIYDFGYEDFQAYIQACEEMGFQNKYPKEEINSLYVGTRPEGYEITLRYIESMKCVEIELKKTEE